MNRSVLILLSLRKQLNITLIILLQHQNLFYYMQTMLYFYEYNFGLI